MVVSYYDRFIMFRMDVSFLATSWIFCTDVKIFKHWCLLRTLLWLLMSCAAAFWTCYYGAVVSIVDSVSTSRSRLVSVSSRQLWKPHEKISYWRDSAHQWSLSHSRSFKITNFDINRKPVCDLKVNNTKLCLHPIWYYYQLSHIFVKLLPLIKGCPSLMHSFSIIFF